MDLVQAAARQFAGAGAVAEIESFGNGNINKTFLVTVTGGDFERFVLQRINENVFVAPPLVMANLTAFSQHVQLRLQATADKGRRAWEVPAVLPSLSGENYWIDSEGGFWRGLSLIEDVETHDTIRDMRHAREIGEALGTFHGLISDLPADRLEDTLVGFHITPGYLESYDSALSRWSGEDTDDVTYCRAFVEKRRAGVAILEDAKEAGTLLVRPIHGDPKINNILVDVTSGYAVSIVDLDTVKPGLVHYDIGDCLRSGCNRRGEETTDWREVSFDLDLCREILRGYLSEATFLTETDRKYLYDSIRLIAFELGLRFFTDHLNGNIYFTASHPTHNLERALVQFQLAASIESQEAQIREIVAAA